MSKEPRIAHRIEGQGTVALNEITGQILNISRSGLAFKATEPLEQLVGTVCRFAIDYLKSDISQEDIHLEISGIIRHSKPDETGEGYLIGVELESLTDEQQGVLDQFLAFQFDTYLFWED